VDTPGRWDHFPSGLVAHFTPDVNGRVVMAAGDMILPQMKLLSEPIAFTIEAGMVTSIDGGVEAKAIRDTLEGHRDPRAYAVSHIGWGTHPAAVWSNRGMGMDGRSFEAGVLFSLGPNVEFGGENDTACHLDLPMHGCSLWLDGELVFAGGTFVDALPDAAR
jgi:2,5-dihydroxypyridine 5,6-dioxygenase